MYLLDTNTVSNYLDKRRSNPHLRDQLAQCSPDLIWISVITLEEVVKGALDSLNQARKHPRNGSKIIAWCEILHGLMRDLMDFQILPYDLAAEQKFAEIPATIRNQHSQDCHIAAIALSRGCTVITSNTRHFLKINGLKCEDWTVEESEDANDG